MKVTKSLDPRRVQEILDSGGLLIDMRPVDEYLEGHVEGSISILFEAGPGFGGRARDLLPLDATLVLLDDPGFSSGGSQLLARPSPTPGRLLPPRTPRSSSGGSRTSFEEAAAMLRGKGLNVAGPADGTGLGTRSTPITEAASNEFVMIDVKDPGTRPLPGAGVTGAAQVIPAERLWTEAAELDKGAHIGVLAGWGVRAATAIGILERLGFEHLTFVRTRPAGARPPTAGPEEQIFRVGGSGG